MCQLLAHGGPDDEGLYCNEEDGLVLGHRRLSLIDLSAAGHQPMQYGERFVITFNGEIYNFPELKEELMGCGYHFRTLTDTEVIMAAFEHWGWQSFEKLSGMFAFALYDTQNSDLYLVRDVSGIKPLYYFSNQNAVVFASEIRAFTAAGDFKENSHWPVYQLAYGFLPEPITTLKEVKPLPKGFFYKINLRTKKASLQSFAHQSFSSTINDYADGVQEVKAQLYKSVGRHLLSDAPIGVFLSGGIDSSILSILASNFKGEKLKTLSLYFAEQQYSEKMYQDIINRKLNCRYFQHELGKVEFEECLPRILQDMDMPSCDGINTWFISKYARQQGLKAVLSGIGSDELFGGYPSFDRMSIVRQLQRSPDLLLRMAKSKNVKAIRRLPYLSLPGIKGQYLYLRGQYIPIEIAQQLGIAEKEVWEILKSAPVYSTLHHLSAKNEASWMEWNIYMQNQLLRDADVMSMAHGVEIRVPFLDKDFVQSALSLSSEIKYRGRHKKILVDSFIDVLPSETWKRKKMGFSFPFSEWFGKSEFIRDLMADSDIETRKRYASFKKGDLPWNQLMLLIFLRKECRPKKGKEYASIG